MAIPRGPSRATPRLAPQCAGDSLRNPGIQRHALLGGGPFRLGLDLVDQPQGHPPDITAGVAESCRAGLEGRWRSIAVAARGPRSGGIVVSILTSGLRSRTNCDPYITAVEAHFHHLVIQHRGDLCGEIGQCVHDGQASRRFERNGQDGCGMPGLLVACGRRSGEIFPQLGDIRREIHDVKYGVKGDVSQDVNGVAVGSPGWSRTWMRGDEREWCTVSRPDGADAAASSAPVSNTPVSSTPVSSTTASNTPVSPTAVSGPLVRTVPLRVQLIAKTEFFPPADVPWSTDTDGGQALAEFAGRACYQSWRKPNPATATNAGYLRHILEVGHLSVLEHGTVSFYITGMSRSLTHELIRHRHFSYSQLSQRYVPERSAAMVEPDVIADDPELHQLFQAAARASQQAYNELLTGLEKRFAAEPNATLRRKQARQAARSVLPNATETRIVVTGNYRAWRHFIAMRATEHADVEIRALAVECLRQLHKAAPNVFSDFEICTLPDGTEIASSPFVSEG
jgi:thymidylate synthase (FAD)